MLLSFSNRSALLPVPTPPFLPEPTPFHLIPPFPPNNFLSFFLSLSFPEGLRYQQTKSLAGPGALCIYTCMCTFF